jgi:hypothetical protein
MVGWHLLRMTSDRCTTTPGIFRFRVVAVGHGDVDGGARPGEQPVALGGSVMAEHGDWPGAEQAAPQLRLPVRLAGEGRIHPVVQPLPVAVPEPLLHSIRGKPQPRGLPAGDDARLAFNEIPAFSG